MPMFRCILCIIVIFACTNTIASDSSESRWLFSVGDYPVIEGEIVVRFAVGTNVTYTTASPGTSVQLSMFGNYVQSLMIMYKDTKVTCMKSPETEVAIENSRLGFSGAVDCITNPNNPRERESVSIKGWFDRDD